MPLRNRVTPDGRIIAAAARGTMMGNRGVLHDEHRRIVRTHKNTAWLICLLEFRGRRRAVMSPGTYTELFFLDEVTAFAAGHRPCFECRRAEATAFAAAWAKAGGKKKRPSAPEMDVMLHDERLDGHAKRLHRLSAEDLPAGAMVSLAGAAFAVKGDELLHWTPIGYGERRERPRTGKLDVLTPPAMVAALKAGYLPRWHESAEA